MQRSLLTCERLCAGWQKKLSSLGGTSNLGCKAMNSLPLRLRVHPAPSFRQLRLPRMNGPRRRDYGVAFGCTSSPSAWGHDQEFRNCKTRSRKSLPASTRSNPSYGAFRSDLSQVGRCDDRKTCCLSSSAESGVAAEARLGHVALGLEARESRERLTWKLGSPGGIRVLRDAGECLRKYLEAMNDYLSIAGALHKVDFRLPFIVARHGIAPR